MAKKAILRLTAVAVMVVLIGTGSAWADLTDGLVAHWKLDGDANDSAGSNDGTLVNGPVWTTGQIGGALDFDGTSDYVRIPDDDSISVGDQDYTICAWIKPDTLSSAYSSAIVSKVRGGDDKEYHLVVGTNRSLRLAVEKDGNNQKAVTTDSLIAEDLWQHVVVTFDSSTKTVTFYYNGVFKPSTSTIDTLPDELNDDLYIGVWGGAYHPYGNFDGKIDDVRIYDRALSAEEVKELCCGQLLSLEVVGPDEVAEKFQAQYKAIADYELASDVDVTDSANWSVEPNDNCSIAAGLLTTEMIDLPTNVTITAQYSESDVNEVAEKDVSIFAICPSGSALKFDGVDDYIQGSSSPFDFEDTTFTVCGWFKTTASLYPHILSEGGCEGGWSVGGTGTAYPGCMAVGLKRKNSTNWAYRAVTLNTYDDGNWHYFAAVITTDTLNASGNQADIYMDGQLAQLQVDSYGYPYGSSSKNWRIGTRAIPTAYFNGTIDDVSIYDRALSDEEIQTLMHTRPDTDDLNLVAYWDFDEGSGQVAGDLAGGNDGQLGSTGGIDDNDPNWTDSIPPVGICSVEEIVERNLLKVLGMKSDVLDILDEAIGKEGALWEYMDTVFKDRDFGNTSKSDVVKAKQRIHSAIQHEEQAETAVDQSIDKLDDALDTLGLELDLQE